VSDYDVVRNLAMRVSAGHDCENEMCGHRCVKWQLIAALETYEAKQSGVVIVELDEGQSVPYRGHELEEYEQVEIEDHRADP